MQSGPSICVKVLLCVFICRCYGAPSKEVGQSSTPTQRIMSRYTEVEDKFIIQELPALIDDYIQDRSKNFWHEMAHKFSEKWKAGTPGFIKERTASSLCSRFDERLLLNLPSSQVKVPECLKQKVELARAARELKVLERGDHYTPEENAFIIKELLSQPSTLYNRDSIWTNIKSKHDKKRLAHTRGFDHERTVKGMRAHFFQMKKRGLLPTEIRDKLKTYVTKKAFLLRSQNNNLIHRVSGASTSQPAAQNQQPNAQEANVQLDYKAIADWIEELKNTDVDIDIRKLKSRPENN